MYPWSRLVHVMRILGASWQILWSSLWLVTGRQPVSVGGRGMYTPCPFVVRFAGTAYWLISVAVKPQPLEIFMGWPPNGSAPFSVVWIDAYKKDIIIVFQPDLWNDLTNTFGRGTTTGLSPSVLSLSRKIGSTLHGDHQTRKHQRDTAREHCAVCSVS